MTAPSARTPDRRGGAPESVGEILRRSFRDVRPAAVRRRNAVGDAWEKVAGADLAADTRPSTLQRGVLTIEVRSTALLTELQGFRREELLARLLAEDPSGRITGLRFRLGVF